MQLLSVDYVIYFIYSQDKERDAERERENSLVFLADLPGAFVAVFHCRMNLICAVRVPVFFGRPRM